MTTVGATPAPPRRWHAELAWLSRPPAAGPPGRTAARALLAADVLIEARDGRFTAVSPGTPAASVPPGTARLPGLTLPGLANAHSHAFHRALRGGASGGDSFWTWRDRMYAVAERLDPARYFALARAVYAEMALAGITCVGEFHYLHHDPSGNRYSDPNEFGRCLIAAAASAGVRITLLDACYLAAGFAPGGTPLPLAGAQLRFSDGSAAAWAERVSAFGSDSLGMVAPHARLGAAIHSVRAVAPDQVPEIMAWSHAHGAPVHAHLSEQPLENAECRAAFGRTPAEVLYDAGALGPRTTLVHATHLTERDVELLGGSRSTVCMCPLTEADLADGVGPAPALAAAGSPLALGSDGHSVIDLFDEARWLELSQRLVTRRRGHFSAADQVTAATAAGHACLGWPGAGEIVPGAYADLVTLSLDSPRLAGGSDPLSAVFAAGTAADVRHVVSSGVDVVRDGRHLLVDDVPGQLAAAISAVLNLGAARMARSLLITRIGELVTNAPDGSGRGQFAAIGDAALVIEGDRVAWTGPASRAPAADDFLDAAGRAVLPGFVDSHAHLVFAGERSAEFAARMAGERYAAGGIRVTVAATRAASDAELRAGLHRLAGEMLRQGTTTFECKSGYGLTVADEARSAALAAEVTPEATYLGAHVVPAEFAADPAAYLDLVCGPMLEACAPYCRWADVFCERGAFGEDEARAVLTAGLARGLLPRIHAGQLGPGPGILLAVELGAASADHCTFLTDADVAALASSDTVATLLPGAEFSTRQPYPDARRLLDAGATVALATDCNPGTSYTTSMPFCVALAVRDMHMTTREAVWSATAGGARALRRTDVGYLAPGARADLIILDAPSHAHLAYRPGVPLVHAVYQSGCRIPGIS